MYSKIGDKHNTQTPEEFVRQQDGGLPSGDWETPADGVSSLALFPRSPSFSCSPVTNMMLQLNRKTDPPTIKSNMSVLPY